MACKVHFWYYFVYPLILPILVWSYSRGTIQKIEKTWHKNMKLIRKIMIYFKKTDLFFVILVWHNAAYALSYAAHQHLGVWVALWAAPIIFFKVSKSENKLFSGTFKPYIQNLSTAELWGIFYVFHIQWVSIFGQSMN